MVLATCWGGSAGAGAGPGAEGGGWGPWGAVLGPAPGLGAAAAAAAGGCPPAPRITWAPPRGRWRAGHRRLAQPLAGSI